MSGGDDSKVGVVDYIFLVLTILISVAIGLYQGYKNKIDAFYKGLANKFKTRNKVKSKDIKLLEIHENQDAGAEVANYLTGNSSLGPIPIALSLLATFFSTNSILGLPAETYQVQYINLLRNIRIIYQSLSFYHSVWNSVLDHGV